VTSAIARPESSFGSGNSTTMAVVTDTRVVRGIVTAVGWVNPRICAFAFIQGARLRDARGVHGAARS
jgi:hypothetical protein